MLDPFASPDYFSFLKPGYDVIPAVTSLQNIFPMKIQRYQVVIATLGVILILGCSACNKKTGGNAGNTDARVNDLVSKMTLEEKVGQMTQVTLDVILTRDSNNAILEPQRIDTARLRDAVVNHHVGSILNVAQHANTREQWHTIISAIQEMAVKETRLGIPVLYGIDAIHGASYTEGATLFPQEVGMAATFNKDLTEKAAAITAYETRASYIPWTFSPSLDLGRNAVWPRLWEAFGEDVYLSKTMAAAMIRGYEGDSIGSKYKVAACLKHYMGYSLPLSGQDRTPAWIPEIFLREYILPSYAEAIKEGAHSVMVCSGEINGVPVHADHHILTDILYKELGLKGFVVSDWEDIKRLHTNHRVAATQKEAVKMAVMAGIDMSMVPYDYSFYDYLLELVKDKEVPESRIDEAVKRILKVKMELGLFENPLYPPSDYPKFGSEEHRLVSLEAARESITLLKNENDILPLPKTARVLVTGFAANSMRCLNGGWSYTWQGELTDKYAAYKNTILEAIEQKAGKTNVIYSEGCSYDSLRDVNRTLQLARSCDYIILCLGEMSYCETPGNISDLNLPDAQVTFAKQLAATGKPVILVLTEGRPRLISKFANNMKGILLAYLPGNEGGPAIADILYGDVNPSGRLPYTYPRHPNLLLNYDHKYSEDTGANRYDVQYPFGYGLSYSTFSYSGLKLDKKEIKQDGALTVSVTVTNTGKIKGKEPVLLYVSDLFASITPPVKRLRGYEKIELEPGESKTVSFNLKAEELAFVNQNLSWIVEPGEFEVSINGLKQKFNLIE